MRMTEQVSYLAHHSLLLALPALAPAFVVAGVVVYISVRDRRRGETQSSDDEL